MIKMSYDTFIDMLKLIWNDTKQKQNHMKTNIISSFLKLYILKLLQHEQLFKKKISKFWHLGRK